MIIFCRNEFLWHQITIPLLCNIAFFLNSFYNLVVPFTGLAECQLQHFLRTPEDTEVTEGDTVVLFCQVGNQIGQVQWTKDGLTLGKFLTSFLFVSCLINLFPEIFQVMTVSYPGLIVTQSLGKTLSVPSTYK